MEIKVAACGQVDAGKTSTVACLRYDILDDGRGSARQKIFIHPHEKESGRTSSVSKIHLHINDGNYISFVDLAGHEKYFRTTIHGVTSNYPDYAMIMVGSNMGVSKMTREHLSLVFSLKIPIFFVLSKLDICPPNILEETINDIKKLCRKTRKYDQIIYVENVDQAEECIKLYQNTKYEQINTCPIFPISNKTGLNMDLLKHFVSNIPVRRPVINNVNSTKKIFRIHDKFMILYY